MKKQAIFLIMFCTQGFFACAQTNQTNRGNNPAAGTVRHSKVYYETDKFAAWPANEGVWNWGNEILVGFTNANHKDIAGHSWDRNTALAKFGRSKDGGRTWQIETAYDNGITESTRSNRVDGKGKIPTRLDHRINFTQQDFALAFRMRDAYDGGTSFYYTYDRGHTWKGPFDLTVSFPGRKVAGIVSRTSYLIEGEHEVTAFLTVGFREGNKDWREVACVRTVDGGMTWKFLSWIGDQGVNAIMPAVLRLGPKKILALTRRTSPPEMGAYISDDNGMTWKRINDPVKVDSNGHPPALLKLKDGRLCLVYGIRNPGTEADGRGMYVVYSHDEGQTWTKPRQIRGGDGPNGDIGYPRAVELPDGKVVAMYYYNHAEAGDKYRYIAATMFEPGKN